MKIVLLAGGTGLVGGALTPFLLEDPEVRVILLLRAGDERVLQERLTRLFDFWEIPRESSTGQRVSALAGDLLLPLLGLPLEVHDRLTREVTHMIHCAGPAPIILPLAQTRHLILSSLRGALHFAQCAQPHRFKKLDYVSTLGVQAVLDSVDQKKHPHASAYQIAKREAECEAIEIAWQRGLGLTIHRPSFVIGDSRTGKTIRPIAFTRFCELLSGRLTGGFVPALRSTLDVISVDYVARAIAWASLREETAGRMFHLCSGRDRVINIRQLGEMARDVYQVRGERLSRLRPIPLWIFLGAVAAVLWISRGVKKENLRKLRMFLKVFQHDLLCDNGEDRQTLEEAGIHLPILEDALRSVLSHL